MGGERPRPSTSDRVAVQRPQPSFLHPPPSFPRPQPPFPRPQPPFPRPQPPFPRPQPSFLRRQEPPHTLTPSQNSSLPPSRGEVRWGVRGHDRPPAIESPSSASNRHSCTPNHHSCAPQPSFLHPQPSFLRPSTVIPAQAGTTQTPTPLPKIHLSPLRAATNQRDRHASQNRPKPRTRVLRSPQSRPAEAPAERFRRAPRAGPGATLVTEALLHDGNPVYRGGEPTTTGNGYVASPAVGMSSPIAAPHWGTATLQRAKRHESRLLRRGRRHRTGR